MTLETDNQVPSQQNAPMPNSSSGPPVIDPTDKDKPLAPSLPTTKHVFEHKLNILSFAADRPQEVLQVALDRTLLEGCPMIYEKVKNVLFYRFEKLVINTLPVENMTNVSGEMTCAVNPVAGVAFPETADDCSKYISSFPGYRRVVGPREPCTFDVTSCIRDPQKKSNWYAAYTTPAGPRPVYDTIPPKMAFWSSVVPSTGNFYKVSVQVAGVIEVMGHFDQNLANYVNTPIYEVVIDSSTPVALGTKLNSFSLECKVKDESVLKKVAGTFSSLQPYPITFELTGPTYKVGTEEYTPKCNHVFQLDTASAEADPTAKKVTIASTLDLGPRVPFREVKAISLVAGDDLPALKGLITYNLPNLSPLLFYPTYNADMRPEDLYAYTNSSPLPTAIVHKHLKACSL